MLGKFIWRIWVFSNIFHKVFFHLVSSLSLFIFLSFSLSDSLFFFMLSLLFSSIFSLLSSLFSPLSSLLSPLSSLLSPLFSSLVSSLLFHLHLSSCLVSSSLVLSRLFLCLPLFLSLSLLCCVVCVVVVLVLLVVVVCVWCVCVRVAARWKNVEKTRVWIQKRLRVNIRNVLVYAGTTRTCARGARTHGDVLNVHTEGVLYIQFCVLHGEQGVIGSSAYQKLPTYGHHVLQRFTKETFGSFLFSSVRID